MTEATGGSSDPAAILNQQLASALSTIGDAQYWEESISPASIRQILLDSDPSNVNYTPSLLKALKWLLASMTKGRDVSDFYPHVVKLVGVVSLEVRKLVYLYLVQYADHDATTRELSLLSINAFQRGLADSEQWIRALALRVLTSIRLVDIIQIQLLAIQKCTHDLSPYVRKCAINALAKLGPRCEDEEQKELLWELLEKTLVSDDSTMVLSSALTALSELDASRLDILHQCFHKLCHLLTDMDEWGQVITIDLLARYCRTYFSQPTNWKQGTAERIDRSRRVRRTVRGIATSTCEAPTDGHTHDTDDLLPNMNDELLPDVSTSVSLPPRKSPVKIKRRVVKKGFYSDEEDESTEEEVFAEEENGPALPISTAFRENPVDEAPNASTVPASVMEDREDSELSPDHKKLLESALPLLKSRNAGVVLAVCSLQYYCGVASIPIRKAIGKALVRIHRDRREIQYVVLASIRTLASQCPSAFSPFLQDFLVKALDPPFTRLIKLDLLLSLALDPSSIRIVLGELSTYVQHEDTDFACASIRAVVRVAEMARLVHDRHGSLNRDKTSPMDERAASNRIALDCLHGLLVLSQAADRQVIVGTCVQMIPVLWQLVHNSQEDSAIFGPIHDPNSVRDRTGRKVLTLLLTTLSNRPTDMNGALVPNNPDDDSEGEEGVENGLSVLEQDVVTLTPEATASALWLMGECFSNVPTGKMLFGRFSVDRQSSLRLEIFRLITRCFVEFEGCEKEQAIGFATKIILLSSSGQSAVGDDERLLCEQLLSMGRVDVNPDVRDQARFTSCLLQSSIGLTEDLEAMDDVPALLSRKPTLEEIQQMFLGRKPPSSSLPVQSENDGDDEEAFRFGTLSSLVGHRARRAYVHLPPWAPEDSPSEIREPKEQPELSSSASDFVAKTGFYDDDGDDEDSGDDSDSDDWSEDDDESDDEDSDDGATQPQQIGTLLSLQAPVISATPPNLMDNADSDDESFDEDDDEDFSSDDDDEGGGPNITTDTLLSMTSSFPNSALPSSISDDLKGLVIVPTTTPTDSNMDRDSGRWISLIRPEHSHGLSVHVRFLRSVTKARESQKLGLIVDKASVVCAQLRLTNETTQSKEAPFRNIRIVSRASSSSSSGSTIRPRQVVVPPTIPMIAPGSTVDCMVGIDFAGTSDRDGSFIARIEVKFGSGGIPADLQPTLGDLLLPVLQPGPASTFDAAIARLQGFQRIEATIEGNSDSSNLWSATQVGEQLLSVAALTRVDVNDDITTAQQLRLMGILPASGDPIYVLATVSSERNGVQLTVCCEHALVVTTVMSLLKRSLQ